MSENGDNGKGVGPFTRRRFLEMVGVVGGASAVYETMVAMGMMPTPAAAAPLQLGKDEGQGQMVLILGAGVGGLTAAYRLQKAGYLVRVLEASDRIGGRNFTVSSDPADKRNVIRQTGRPDQTCRYDQGLYFEAGCGRIPYHHTALLALCAELGVALEPYIMETRANRFQTDIAFNRASIANRRIANDTRGYVAQLLDKAVAQGSLNNEIPSEKERLELRDLLVAFGKIDKTTRQYNGSPRIGYVKEPGVVSSGILDKKLERPDLFGSRFWDHRFYQAEDYEWQTTLFQPVGGMKKIVDALAKAVGGDSTILRGAVVSRITNGATGVEVRTADGKSFKGEFCISTIPLRLLTTALDRSTFEPAFIEAVGTVPLANTCKVGWQTERRFWEDLNGDRIFGGISWIDHPVTQVWYPSAGFFSKGRAVLTGTYNYDSATKKTAEIFGNLSLDERLEEALRGGERLHPNFRQFVPKSGGLSIAWQMVPYLQGGWADWDRNNEAHKNAYARLLLPDQRFYVAGDQMSYLPGWQEGAVLSADHVIAQITRKPSLKAIELPAIEFAPSAASVTGAD
ncbi:MAG TPA: FAD-dependent oxidoreductase [Thermoanaerobaculia bacterium]|jgi:monoamine oxidase|nr:FAD-dependent oxidoreductase [Thermoanaerobaculia bacterium]